MKKGQCASYYETLAERFAAFDFSQIVERNGKKINCPYEEICYPISLPSNHNNISHCHNETHRSRYHEIIEPRKTIDKMLCMESQRQLMYGSYF